MSPKVKNLIIGSFFAALALFLVYEIVGLMDAVQIEQKWKYDINNEIEERAEGIAAHIDRKCKDNPDFLYCQ